LGVKLIDWLVYLMAVLVGLVLVVLFRTTATLLHG
jgi:hypothetical protein